MARNRAKTLSVLDLRSAYFQLKVTEDTADKLAFVTPHRGAHKFLQVAMGLGMSLQLCPSSSGFK